MLVVNCDQVGKFARENTVISCMCKSMCVFTRVCWFGWFVGFYGISTFVGYLKQINFYVNNQFYLKQFSLA